MKSIVFFNLAHHVLLKKSANQRAEMGLDRHGNGKQPGLDPGNNWLANGARGSD